MSYFNYPYTINNKEDFELTQVEYTLIVDLYNKIWKSIKFSSNNKKEIIKILNKNYKLIKNIFNKDFQIIQPMFKYDKYKFKEYSYEFFLNILRICMNLKYIKEFIFIFKLLIKIGMNNDILLYSYIIWNENEYINLIEYSCIKRNIILLEFFISIGVNFDITNPINGNTLLHIICGYEYEKDYLKFFKKVLKYTNDINIRNKYNTTPLQICCRLKNNIFLKLLLNNNAEINTINDNYFCPIFDCIMGFNYQGYKLLILKLYKLNKIDINNIFIPKMHSMYNYSNKTKIPLLYYLTKSHSHPMVYTNLLLQYGATIDIACKYIGHIYKETKQQNKRLIKLYNKDRKNKRQYFRAICSDNDTNEFSLFFKDFIGLRKQIGGLIISYFNSFN